MSIGLGSRRLAAPAAALLSWLVLATPGVAEACSKCLSGRSDEVKLAYILTTVALSLLPPLAIGGVVWWLVRRARALGHLEAREVSPTARPSA